MKSEERPRTSEPSAVPWEKVYLFISSTFNDMHAERDFLVKKVFPRLAEWCERRKLRMVDVDLRWGVTEEEATRNKNVVEVCLNRIDECRPFFLCFLGQRYGWVPRREDLSAATLREFPGLGEAIDGEHSVTELEILHALVRPFHPDDRVESEDFHPARHAFFFLRGESYLEELPSKPTYLRRIYTDEVEEEPEKREFLLAKNAMLRRQTVRQGGRPVVDYEAKWSEAEESPELALPLACPALLDENIARWQRSWHEAAGLVVEGREVAEDQGEEARDFNERLTQGRLTGFRADDRPLDEVILESLEAAIVERFPDHVELEERGDLQRELDQQDQFRFVSSEGFIERRGDFDELNAYVDGDSDRLFVLTAPGGMGKSTLLANWIGRRRAGLDIEGGETLHHRFIGQSDGSTTVDSLLRLLLEELQETVGKLDEEIPADPKELRQKWPEFMQAVGQRGKTILVLDALNQLETGLADLRWLPRRLPAGIKLIASFKRCEEAAERFFEELSEEREVQLAEVKPFASEDDRRNLVEAYLSQYLKELDERHLEELIRTEGAENPLFLKVVLSELRVFGAFASLGEKIRQDFGTDPVAAFDAVLARLERDPAYSAIPPEEAVPLLFGLLAHARLGLSAEELTDLFVQVLGLERIGEAGEAAANTVHLFLRQVRPFIARRDGRYDFFYESFQIAARERFVGEATPEVPGRRSATEWHGLLADGFRSRSDPAGGRTWSGEPRGLAELPYHLTRAECFDELEATLLDFRFLQVKLDAFGPKPLIEDYDRGLAAGNDSSSLRLAGGAVKLSSHVLRRDPGQLPGQLWGRLDGNLSAIRRLLDHARGAAKRPWLRSVVPGLPAASGPLLRTLEGHRKHVECAAILPAGQVVSGSADGTLRIWDLDNGQCLCILEGHRRDVVCVAVLPDGRVVSAGSLDTSIRVWDPHSGETLRTLEGHAGIVTSLAVLPDGRVVSGSLDTSIRVWDPHSGETLRTLEGHAGIVTSLAVLPDGRVVSGSYDKTLRVWNPDRGECLQTLEGHTNSVMSVAVLADGRVVSGSGERYTNLKVGSTALRVWDLDSGECLQKLEGHKSSVGCLVVTPDGRVLSGSKDKSIRIWDADCGETLRVLKRDTGMVTCLAVLPDGRVVSGSRDQFSGNDCRLLVWDPDKIERARQVESHAQKVTGIWGLADGRVASNSGPEFCVWDPETGECQRKSEGHKSSVGCIAVAPDGRIFSRSGDKSLRVWDLASGETACTLEGHTGWITVAAVLADGRVISGSCDSTLRVWDPNSGGCLRTLNGHSAEIKTVGVLPGGRIVSGSKDRSLRVWDPDSGECLHTLKGHTGAISCVTVSADGRVVSGSYDKTLRVWNPDTGGCLRTFEDLEYYAHSVAVLPDGLVLSCSGKALQVWDPDSGVTVCTIRGHRYRRNMDFFSGAAVLPDGRVLSRDLRALRVWDPNSGECLAVFELEAVPGAMCVLASGLIAAGDWSGRVHFLRLEEPDEAEEEQ